MSERPAMPNDAEQVDTDYETEVEAEQTGKTAEEIDEERAEDEATPVDEAYRPRTG